MSSFLLPSKVSGRVPELVADLWSSVEDAVVPPETLST
jgi:hypothetical protein